MGYCNALLNIKYFGFLYSSLKRRFREMIDDEEKKKEKRNEKLLTELCECYLLLNIGASSQLISVCVPCLLKAALKKDENEEAQKEVEMALLALSCIFSHYKIEKDLYLNEMKEIIQYHEKRHNLTRLAYQSAWQFLIILSFSTNYMFDVIVDEMNFVGEAKRELEELAKCVDWKREKEEKIKGKGRKEELVFQRWLQMFESFFVACNLWNKECSGLIESIVQVFLVSRDNHSEICILCVNLFETAAENRAVKLDALLKSGAIDAVFEEFLRPASNERMAFEFIYFFQLISMRLKEEKDDEMEEAKRKELKRKIFEKMEEEGYEDIITTFYEIIDFLNKKYFSELSLRISDYLVNS
ncbi:uncharacterized protein MONOS_18638 [Monocercomonoides exilis]|uniref:uncharacterized protein n=1 Tax=Monocercomonoides exilis TaxID=2049356 RepID=UPI003559449B|nr:hypothetical protein MONOS_18638 [Monocercomonoides exilis]